MIDLRKIAAELGGDVYAGGNAATVPGPGHSKHDRSLSLRLSENGDRVIYHSFAGELRHRDVMAYLGLEEREARESTPADRAKERARREHERRVEEAKDREFCRGVWDATHDAAGSPVEAYLWSRGLVVDGVGDLRFHPAAPRSKEPDKEGAAPPHPAMVALARDVHGAPRGLHVTFIKPDGTGKAFGDRSRLMFGAMSGAALQLGRPMNGVLAVAEGIETAGAYATLHGVATWAALSTSGMQNFVPPKRLRRLIIAADGDRGGARAAQLLAERACAACDVEIHPAPDDQDWNDVLISSEGR